MKNFIKKPVAWLAVFAIILTAALILPQLTPSQEAPVETQPDVQLSGKVESGDYADTNTGSGVSPVDVEEDEEGANDDAAEDVVEEPSLILPQDNLVINQPLNWEGINSIPVKTSSMSNEAARNLCTTFLRYAKTAVWTPDTNIGFIKNGSGSTDSMSVGIAYGGLPYIGLGSGSVYRLMDYTDENGVVDMKKALGLEDLSNVTMAQMKYFGNQCSIGAYWGWGRVINSAKYQWTQQAVPRKDFFALGTYENTAGFDINAISAWTTADKGWNTVKASEAVGAEQMYENYALLKEGDGLVYYTTAGHIVMIASDAHVERDEDGKIIPATSYVTVLDQAQTWLDGANAAGDKYKYKNNVDAKWSFERMFEGTYFPFTYAEFHRGEAGYEHELGAIEETVATIDHVGSTITKSQLFVSSVTSNYGISDIYVIVTDDAGNEVYRHAVRTPRAGDFNLAIVENDVNVTTWGSWADLTADSYNVEIVVQLATGERPTVYLGTLLA